MKFAKSNSHFWTARTNGENEKMHTGEDIHGSNITNNNNGKTKLRRELDLIEFYAG